MTTLAEIRQKLKAAENGYSTTNKFGSDNSVYPFWNIPEGKEAVFRFLPDGDTTNTFFWVERAMIKLPFSGIKGDSETTPITVQVPCVEMYQDGSICPILSEVRQWYKGKDPELEELAKVYWKKRSYIFQGFVTEDGLDEKDAPENPIRRFVIGPQIYALIKAAIEDPELDELPTDYVNGLDFRLKKGSKGKYADYSSSNWSRRNRPLSTSELTMLDNYPLSKLVDFLPKKPTDVELNIMKEMFEASVDGEPYDAEKWGQYYRPAGMSQETGDPTKNTTKSVVLKEKDIPFVDMSDDVPDFVQETTEKTTQPANESVTDNRAASILEMIRNRNQGQ